MIKLDIGVSPHNISLYYRPNKKMAYALSVLVQHRIILNKKIVAYYEECVPEYEREALKNYIASIIGNEEETYWSKDLGKKNNSGIEEIIEQVSNVRMKTLIAENFEIEGTKRKGVNCISVESISNNDDVYKKSYLFKYSIPITNYQILQGTDNKIISQWLGNMFVNERRIIIQDPYIYTPQSLYSFRNNVCAFFSRTVSDIVIYGSISESKTTEED